MSDIIEIPDITLERFHQEVLPAAKPAIFRGLVSQWPIVKAAQQSRETLFNYIRKFDRGYSVSTMFGPPSVRGRFFYNDDMSGFNFQKGSAKLEAALDLLDSNADEESPSWLAVQSVQTRENLPGMEHENPMPLLDPSIGPRLWIGNAVIVAAHHDPSENIACVAAGRRRFTLFPPEQVPNLYLGPYELTPAGTTISMVDFDNPDLEKHPRFAEAQKAALTVDLEPGDALYLPYMWWHHVRSMDTVNVLINYWWQPSVNGRGAPTDAFLHAILAVKDLPPAHRNAWRAMFEHYVFQDSGAPGAHLPADKRGILGPMNTDAVKELRAALSRNLAKS